MSFEPTLEEQELLADTFSRDASTMPMREQVGEVGITCAFAAAVAAIWALHPPQHFAVLPSVLCMVVLAVATLVRFDTPFGFTVPIQLAFVPLLFAMPIAVVPVAVAVALAAVRLPDVLRGEMRPSRLLHAAGNAGFALGPVAVFAIANVEPSKAGAGLLIGALAAQFAVDTLVTVCREVVISGSLSEHFSVSWVYLIDAALSGMGLVVAEDVHKQPIAAVAVLPLLGLLAVFARERHQRLASLLELGNAYRGTALVLGDVVEADDGYTGEHCKSVVALTLDVAEELGLSAEQRRNLEFGALLHDVGKIAIPKEILNKPGKLDAEEWTTIKTHTVEGQKMLDRVGGFMREVGLIVRTHHEHWDGGGYPDGLRGEEIPLEARIIACCDAWNAMRTDRVYRKALPYDVARDELLANSGRQFDPKIVDVLLKVIEDEAPAEVPLTPVPVPAPVPLRPAAPAAG
jgi:putative nucleotidyltransferase with HDIG domain